MMNKKKIKKEDTFLVIKLVALIYCVFFLLLCCFSSRLVVGLNGFFAFESARQIADELFVH